MCLFFKKDNLHSSFSPKQVEKYKNVEKFFHHYKIPFHTDFVFEGFIFDYAFMYKKNVYLVDVYFNPNEELNFGSKLTWSIMNDSLYYVIYNGTAMDTLERIIFNL